MRPSAQSLRPLGLSLAAHLLLLALLAVNLSLWPQRRSQPVRLAIDAAVVPDLQAVRQREAEARRRAEAARRQREALAQERRAAEQRRREAERQRLAEQRQAAAEAERRAAEKRQREAEQRRQAERAAEQRRQAEREAEQRRRQAEREAELQAQLAAEQAREAAIRDGLLDQWIEVIRQKVQRNWIKPPSAGPGLECELRVLQIPGGEVVGVEVGRCNADAAVVRSIENAVYRASPLPPPPAAALFERNIVLIFKPEE